MAHARAVDPLSSGETMVRVLKLCDMSCAQFAALAGVHSSTVRNYITERRPITYMFEAVARLIILCHFWRLGQFDLRTQDDECFHAFVLRVERIKTGLVLRRLDRRRDSAAARAVDWP